MIKWFMLISFVKYIKISEVKNNHRMNVRCFPDVEETSG